MALLIVTDSPRPPSGKSFSPIRPSKLIITYPVQYLDGFRTYARRHVGELDLSFTPPRWKPELCRYQR